MQYFGENRFTARQRAASFEFRVKLNSLSRRLTLSNADLKPRDRFRLTQVFAPRRFTAARAFSFSTEPSVVRPYSPGG